MKTRSVAKGSRGWNVRHSIVMGLAGLLVLVLTIVALPPPPVAGFSFGAGIPRYAQSGAAKTEHGIKSDEERVMTIQSDGNPARITRYIQQAYNSFQQQSNVASLLTVDSLAPGWEYRIDVTDFEVETPGLPKNLDGLKIAHLTDLHVGWFVKLDDVRRMADLVASLDPDLILITGDMVFHHRSQGELQSALEPIATLAARYGVYAALGNHDFWDGVDTVEGALAATGIRLLRNESVEAAPGLWVAGIEDLLAGEPDTAETLRSVPDGAATILMSHNPNILPQVSNRPLLVLAGHSHGGQVVLPGQNFIDNGEPGLYARLMTAFETVGFLRRGGNRQGIGTGRYVSGWYYEGQARMYVGRGLGMVRPPVRINCPAELTLIKLKAAPNRR